MIKKKPSRLQRQKKNPNSSYWKKRADEAWAFEIKRVGHCEHCRGTGQLNAHHIINRTRLRHRYDLSNGVALCVQCHLFNPDFSPHADSFGAENFIKWLEMARPGQWTWYQENKHDKRTPDMSYIDSYELLKEL